MKILKNSKQLMIFLLKNNHINKVKQTKQTDLIVKELYNNIYNAYRYLINLKEKGKYVNTILKQILTAKQITKPKNFNSKSFPYIIRNHIDKSTMYEICYIFSLFERNIKIIFIIEKDNIEIKLETYNNYVDTIIVWLYILNQYSSKQCSNSLNIYLYFTSLTKKLPDSNIFILDEINVNTAFTTTCQKDSEIVIFRKEEWFKVLIHETFHNFALDFSDMNNNDELKKNILNIFQVNSEVNLYESYTEFWAEIINISFCSFISLKDKTNLNDFLSNFEILINYERTFSFMQLNKTLNFMGLSYKDLFANTELSRMKRENLYKEKTNVLAYYIIKTILINNYQGFLFWCKTNNFSLFEFKKTYTNQKEFCKFIEKNYKTLSMLNGVNESKSFLNNINKTNKNNKIFLQYVLSNLRMSICELG